MLIGGFLVLIGALLLLDNLGLFPFSVWGLFWPLVLILLGVWVLWGFLTGPPSLALEEATIPLEGASAASVRLRHGAGKLTVAGTAPAGALATGAFAGGLEHSTRREGETLHLDMRIPRGIYSNFFLPVFWAPGRTLDWTVALSAEVPLQLDLDTGASASRIDLTGLQVTDLRLNTGASTTELVMPGGAGHTRARIASGAAEVKIRIPEGVAADITAQAGLASIEVDRRFERSGNRYRSPDYDTAAHRLDLAIETGVAAVTIR